MSDFISATNGPVWSPKTWFSNVKGDLLAGTVVAMALIPEAITFSLIADLPPAVGLYASFCIAVIISFTGGRPAMISAATGAMAVVLATLAREHGLQYVLAATILTGVIQLILGMLKVGEVMRYVSRSVVTGFVNALAIVIFMAQWPELGIMQPHEDGESWHFVWMGWETYAMVLGALAIIYGLPRLTKAVPSPLVALVAMTGLALGLGWVNRDLDLSVVRTVFHIAAEKGAEMPSTLPPFLIPDVPFSLQTLWIILPYSVSLAAVGLLESLLTAQIVDEMTETGSRRNKEARGQGIANMVTGFFGGMAGCAMIGQSVINVKSGGRGRLSTLWAGVFLMILLVMFGDWLAKIPMPALVGVMIMVSIGTFSWRSIKDMGKHPWTTNAVMLITVIVTIWSHNLALGVGAGVLLATLFFARKMAAVMLVESELQGQGVRRYTVYGQVFFASGDSFVEQFDLSEKLEKVVIDMSHAHFWDLTGVGALDKVVLKFRKRGVDVEVLGMNEASKTIVSKLGVHDKDDEIIDELAGH